MERYPWSCPRAKTCLRGCAYGYLNVWLEDLPTRALIYRLVALLWEEREAEAHSLNPPERKESCHKSSGDSFRAVALRTFRAISREFRWSSSLAWSTLQGLPAFCRKELLLIFSRRRPSI